MEVLSKVQQWFTDMIELTKAPRVQQWFTLMCYLLASLMVLYGFALQFSSDTELGLYRISGGFFMMASLSMQALLDAADTSPSSSLKTELDKLLKTLKYRASVTGRVGKLVTLISLLSCSNGKVTWPWVGLFGSSLILIEALIKIYIGFQDAPNESDAPNDELTAVEKMQEIA